MKIVKVDAIPLVWKCPEIADAMNISTARKALLLKIETDSGLFGIGEAFLYGCSIQAGKTIIEEHFRPLLLDLEISVQKIEHIWDKLFWNTVAFGKRGIILGLIGGIDIALWDLVGKIERCSISTLLGRRCSAIPSYASGGFYAKDKSVDDLKQEIAQYASKGYKRIKIKVGRNERAQSPLQYSKVDRYRIPIETDFERIQAAKEILGCGNVAIDANMSWTIEFIRHYRTQLQELNIWWVEEPLLSEDLLNISEAANILNPIPIAGFETEQRFAYFKTVIENNSVGIVQPDVSWVGGITECMKIAKLASSHHKPVSLHSFGSAIHFAASLQVASATECLERMESEENPNPLRDNLCIRPFEADGEMNYHVSDKPGLGIELDWNKVEQYIQ